jgi:hypothetical protein
MIALVQAVPTLTAIQIFSGLSPGLLREVLVNPNLQVGTRIRG